MALYHRRSSVIVGNHKPWNTSREECSNCKLHFPGQSNADTEHNQYSVVTIALQALSTQVYIVARPALFRPAAWTHSTFTLWAKSRSPWPVHPTNLTKLTFHHGFFESKLRMLCCQLCYPICARELDVCELDVGCLVGWLDGWMVDGQLGHACDAANREWMAGARPARWLVNVPCTKPVTSV